MRVEIDRINQALPQTRASRKTVEIRQWIRSVINSIEHYNSEHSSLLREATTLLELALWKAILDNDEAAAAERKKTSSASTHQRTSTRERSPVNHDVEKSLPCPQGNDASRGRKRKSSPEEDRPRKKVVKKCECSADGCMMNHAQEGGVCIKHGAKKKLCSSDGCTNLVRWMFKSI